MSTPPRRDRHTARAVGTAQRARAPVSLRFLGNLLPATRARFMLNRSRMIERSDAKRAAFEVAANATRWLAL
jgi:hypothetical protein